MAAHDYLKLDDDMLEAARRGDAAACEAFFRQFERPGVFPGAAAVRHPALAGQFVFDGHVHGR